MNQTTFRGSLLAGIVAVAGLVLAGEPSAEKSPLPARPTLEDLPLKDSVSQYGITWSFEKPARVGQFVNGDWYVVGPVTIAGISPMPRFGDEVGTAPVEQRDIHEVRYQGEYARDGSTLNLPAVVPRNKVTPRVHRSGFDSRMPMDAYDPNQFARLPIAMKAGDSLVSSISNEPLGNGGYPIKSVAILTCMATPQPADAFRPSFCQTATCKNYLARNLRRDRLLNLARPAAAANIKPQDYAGHFQEPWIDTVGYGRAMPRKKFQFWGPQIAELAGGGSLLLLLDYSPQEKEPLLINMVQVGIDLFGLLRGGGGWPAEGGYGCGRKWLILFAGMMLDDPEMQALTKYYPDGRFHEDEQTAFCPLPYNGQTFEHGWTGARVVWTGHYGLYKGQWPANKWPGGYGPVDLFPPAEWPSPWPRAESDRRNTSSAAWVGEALAARLLHAEKLWDHDAFFVYVDRWMNEDDTPSLGAIRKNLEGHVAKTDDEKKSLDARAEFAAANRQGTITGTPELAGLVKSLWVQHRPTLAPPQEDWNAKP